MKPAKKSGISEELKRRDQLRWVQEVNSYRNMAEESVPAEHFD